MCLKDADATENKIDADAMKFQKFMAKSCPLHPTVSCKILYLAFSKFLFRCFAFCRFNLFRSASCELSEFQLCYFMLANSTM